MLYLTAQGRAKFSDHAPGIGEVTAKVYVKVQLGNRMSILAQLDTGAAWSVLDPETAQRLGYSGLLDAIRFALDPQANDFYFGLPAERW